MTIPRAQNTVYPYRFRERAWECDYVTGNFICSDTIAARINDIWL